MNKFLLLTIIFAFASIVSVGSLGVNFDMIAQALGIFHTADVTLLGCDCVDALGNPLPTCDDANVVVTNEALCPTSPANIP